MTGNLSTFLSEPFPASWGHDAACAIVHLREQASRMAVVADHGNREALRNCVADLIRTVAAINRIYGFDSDKQAADMEAKIRRRMQPAEGSKERFGSWKAGKVREKGKLPLPAEISPELPALMRLIKTFRYYPPKTVRIADFLLELDNQRFERAFLFLSAWAFHGKMDPEHALRLTNEKFFRRLSGVEKALAQVGKRLDDSTLDEMMALWGSFKTQRELSVFKASLVRLPQDGEYPGFHGLLQLAAFLADPKTGDSWTLSQTPFSIALHAVEESFEVTDAFEKQDLPLLSEELGDMIMQGVFMTENCQRREWFGMGDVLDTPPAPPCAVAPDSIFASMPEGQSALARALWLQETAVAHGFEWRDMSAVRAKVDEEILELEAECSQHRHMEAQRELGDLMFATLKLARWQQGGFDEHAIMDGLEGVLA